MPGAGMRIHPRKSFERWKEVIKGKSTPWTLNELEITQIFLKDIIAILLRNQAAELEILNIDLSAAAETLKAKNNQLEDFAWIMSHNLKSPLINIDGLYNFYKEEPNQENAAFVMGKIKLVSDNMAETIDDLNVILKTRIDSQLDEEKLSLVDLIEKEKQNLAAIMEQTQAELNMELQEPYILLPKIYAESILHNLISNAIKYRSPNRQPLIIIKSWLEHNRFYLSVSDNGLGMDLKKMGHKLFGLYQTFHQHENAKGLGLYLTKMQVEALGGNIEVMSELRKGTTLTISLSSVKN